MTGCAMQENGVLVLGMHRSGTSAVAACLERLGVVMGDELVQADEWNPKGYFEERRIVAFNNRLLDLQGLRWDSPLPPSPAMQAQWSGQTAPAAALLRELFADAPAWGFKDPRMCLLAPFWTQVFATMQLRPRMLLVLRHPAEVVDSLTRRDGISMRRAGWLWFMHLLGALDYLQTASEGRLIDFADLLSEPARQLGELGGWLGRSLDEDTIRRFTDDFIAPRLAKSADARVTSLHPLILEAYAYWQATARGRPFAIEWLQAPEWLAIRQAFERDIKPELETVQRFFEGDRQASVADARLMAMSRGLSGSEQLALARLDQIASLDAQLKRTSEALSFADELARQRLAEIEALSREMTARDERWAQVEQAMGEREEAWATRFSELEHLSEARQQRLCGLDQELRQTADALVRAERLALARLADVEALDREMNDRSERWLQVEQAMAERENAWAKRFSELECLAKERLQCLHELDQQLQRTSEALALAEHLALERLSELEKARASR